MKKLLLASILLAQIAAGAQSRTGTVAGVIRNPDGSPAARVRVTAMAAEKGPLDASATYLSFAESDESGRYRLESIPPGRYHIVAGRIDLPTYYPGTTDRSGAREVSVTADAIVGEVDFVLDPATLQPPTPLSRLPFGQQPATPSQQRRVAGRFIIQGRATDATLVIGPGTVRAERVSDGVAATVESQPNGRFGLSLDDGDYRIRITPPRGYAVKSAFFGTTDLTLQPSKVDSSLPPPVEPRNNRGLMVPLQFGGARQPGPEIVITLVPQTIL